MSLHDLQQQFKEAIIDRNVPKEFEQEIIPAGNLSVAESIEVYQDGYPSRLSEAMQSTYEATAWAMGEAGFMSYAVEYLYRYPSRYYDLNQYGKGFPKYLRQQSDLMDEYPFLSDLAEFEWIFKEVFDLSKPIRKKEQPKVFSADTVLEFDSSLRFFQTEYSIYQFWQLRGSPRESLEGLDFSNEEFLILYKSKEGLIFIDSISKTEFGILEWLQNGKTIGETLEHYDHLSQEEAQKLFQKIGLSDFYLGVQAQS